MGHDAPDIDGEQRKQYLGHQAVMVALDVEHVATLADVVRRGEFGQQVVVARPGAELHLEKPHLQGFPCLGVLAAVARNGISLNDNHGHVGLPHQRALLVKMSFSSSSSLEPMSFRSRSLNSQEGEMTLQRFK